jgi:hypothetical protein
MGRLAEALKKSDDAEALYRKAVDFAGDDQLFRFAGSTFRVG